MRRRWRLDSRLVIGLLAVAGLGAGLLLDQAGFLEDQPLAGNVVAGILGSPATVLLAMVVFERLQATQRVDSWLSDRGAFLRRTVTPQIDALLTTLAVTWPMEATETFDDDLAVLVDQWATVPQPERPVGSELLARTTRVAELAQRADPEASLGPVEATVETLDLLIHQDSAPRYAEAATDLRAIANAYIEQVTASGYAVRRFTGAVSAVAFRSWTWETDRRQLVFRTETSEWNVSPGGISHDGFLYRAQLAQARRLASAARRVRSLLEDGLSRADRGSGMGRE